MHLQRLCVLARELTARGGNQRLRSACSIPRTEQRAFGDAEGVRHNLRALAHRCDALATHKADAAAYSAEAEQLEQVLGKPTSAKQVFSRIDGLPSTQPDLPEQLAALAPRDKGEHAPPPRGAKSGTLTWCKWEQSISDVTVTVPLPPGVQKRSLSVGFRRQGLSVSLTGGVIIADAALGGRIQTDECTWTLSDGAVCVTLEKAENKVWDYLLNEPPPPPPTTTSGDAATTASAAAPVAASVDVSDPETRATRVAAALSGLGIADPSAERLLGAAIGAELAPPKPTAVATGPTEQAASPPRTGAAAHES
jgi:hypothetical protein